MKDAATSFSFLNQKENVVGRNKPFDFAQDRFVPAGEGLFRASLDSPVEGLRATGLLRQALSRAPSDTFRRTRPDRLTVDRSECGRLVSVIPNSCFVYHFPQHGANGANTDATPFVRKVRKFTYV